jgi:ATP-dependent Lhr-like helicase
VVYVSPLKALSNDVQKNLEAPLAELTALAARDGLRVPPIRVAVRTGDTPAADRARMAKTPPHVLVTTPESLYILLTSGKGRASLAAVRAVVVDEIHAVASDKRGAHLALSLERLDRLVVQGGGPRPTRIGLSATQKPIELIGSLLTGAGRPPPRIVDAGFARHIDLAIELTDDPLGAVASGEQMGRIYDRIAELCGQHRSTLVFVNTRRLVERVSHALEQRMGEDQVVAHHGSLSRQLRLKAEQRLKAGQVRCAVATASLELGIDVGAVELVIQVGSPRAIATLLQRVGRSGHSLAATPKGRLFAMTRDQLGEAAALIRAIRGRRLDALTLRDAPLDVLAQQIIAMVACEDLAVDELYELVRRARSYAELSRETFDQVMDLVAEGATTRPGRTTAHLHLDRVNGVVRPRRGARLAAITCGGAIPDTFNYPVVTFPDESPVGSVDEDFAIDSSAGDIFLLGNTSWRIRRIEAGRVLVEDAGGAPPTIPFWFGEAPARTAELSDEVAALRREVDERLSSVGRAATVAWLAESASMPLAGAEQLTDYLAAARAALGALPTTDTIIAERFFDDAGGMQLIIHAPLGGRINKAWGLALRKRFCRGFNQELQAAATDDGIILSLGPVHSFPLAEVFDFLRSATVKELLTQAVLDAPVFGVRWRWAVTRALTVLRRHGGKRVPPHLLRMRTDDLMSLVFPMAQACLENVVGDIELPDHPLVKEAMRDSLEEFLDVDGLVRLLADIEAGRVKVIARDTLEPSPLGHEIINANPYAFLDDAPLEERRTRAVNLPRVLATDASGPRMCEAASIAQAEDEATPPVRDGDELHDLLLSLLLLPVEAIAEAGWGAMLDGLAASRRATRVTWRAAGEARTAWVAAERLALVRLALPADAALERELPPIPARGVPPERERAIAEIVGAHLACRGPRTAATIAAAVGLERSDVEVALAALESEGGVLRGRFTVEGARGEADEACDRRMLARIHRLTVGRLRREIEPVPAATLMRFLFRWQRLAPGCQLIGEDGLGRLVDQLQGFESAAGAWEREILPARLHGYEPGWLDNLCLGGRVSWARLSPRAAASDDRPATACAPTRAAPLALLRREDLAWLRAAAPVEPVDETALGGCARAVHRALADGGAMFLVDLVARLGRDRSTPLDPSEIEDALWELVGAGLATADGFASLRVLVDRKKGESRSVFDRPQAAAPARGKWADAVKRARERDRGRPASALRSLPTAAGRWSLLPPPRPDDVDPERSARQLLDRYGVVFRDLLARECSLPSWRDLLSALRRLEARGEIRGGRFVAGFVGEQFALPEAVELVRALRKTPDGLPEIVRVAGCDPLNLVGVTSPGPRLPAVLGNAVLYKNGTPLASLEAGELRLRGRLEPGETVDPDLAYHPPPRLDLGAFQVALPLEL